MAKEVGRMIWSPEQVKILKAMWARNATPAMIATRLNRTKGQVHDKRRRLDLPRREPKPKPPHKKNNPKSSVKPSPDLSQQAMRKCLGPLCGGRMFLSDWPGHRRCKTCAAATAMRGSLQEGFRVFTRKGGAL